VLVTVWWWFWQRIDSDCNCLRDVFQSKVAPLEVNRFGPGLRLCLKTLELSVFMMRHAPWRRQTYFVG
jgi:hypothetical protein